METLVTKIGDYGVAGILVAIILLYCYKRLNALEERLEKDNTWKMQVIENDTKATLGQTAAQVASTQAIQELKAAVDNIGRRWPQ